MEKFKTGDKIKCIKSFENLGIIYNKNEVLEIFEFDEKQEDVCEITIPQELGDIIVTMDKDYLINFELLT